MRCNGCIFVWRGDRCRKRDFVSQLRESNPGYKEKLFLDFQVRVLNRKQYCKCVCDFSEFEAKFDAWCVSVKVGLGKLEGLPLVRVIRKFAPASLRPVSIRAFCCYVHCPDQRCGFRRRGARCVKQKKIRDCGGC